MLVKKWSTDSDEKYLIWAMHCSDMVELCSNDHHPHLLDSDDDGIELHSVLVSKAEETLVKNWQMKQAYATLRINGSNKEIYYKKYEDI